MNSMDMTVRIGELRLKNPVTVASGTFGFGEEYACFYDTGKLGALFIKGLTMKEREGNPPPRIFETPAGMINSIGLQNPGLEGFLDDIVPGTKKIGTAIIANVSGESLEEYIAIARRLRETDAVDAIELNVSCPNVRAGGIEFGKSGEAIARLTEKTVNAVHPMPVIVKLTPLVADIAEMARIAEQEGADAVSLINTLPAMVIDWKKDRLSTGRLIGGLSGPAIKPVALRLVWDVSQSVDIPVIGMGGIRNVDDALQFFSAGADAISIGTANFINPTVALEVLEGLTAFMQEHAIESIDALKTFVQT